MSTGSSPVSASVELVAEGLLKELTSNSYYALGCPDDIVVITRGKFNLTVRKLIQNTLNFITRWVVERKDIGI